MASDKKSVPTLRKVIEETILDNQKLLNTCMPGIVQSYDTAKNTIVVKPSFKRKYKDGSLVDLPTLEDVPVAFPRANSAAITFPLKKGDVVLLIFSQRCLDQWKISGGTVAPNNARLHDISDAIAIPGVYPSNDSVPIEPTKLAVRYKNSKVLLSENGDIEIVGKKGLIKVGKDGKITIGNGTIELLDLLDQLLTALGQLTVNTALGPSGPPNNLATFTQLQQKLAMIKA